MEYNRKEALRYLRARADDQQALALLDLAYLALRNEVQARHVLLRQKIGVDAEGVTLADGTRFHSRALAAHLAGCGEALLLAATLGSRVDAAIRRLALASVAQGAAAQAVAAALIESYCDEVQARAAGALGNLRQKPRFSPGYADWDLSEQHSFFRVLDCARRIGLTLTEGCMMAPAKSVTAIIGLAEESGRADDADDDKCARCANINCPYRS